MQEHLRFVDGLRAVAILGVIVVHAYMHGPAWGTQPLGLFAMQGNHGVELFFVISGFCLAYPTLARMRAGEAYRFNHLDYAAKRIVRIFPPFLIALGALIALSAIPQWFGPLSHSGVSASSFTLLDIAREAALFDGGPLHDTSFWSLAVELRWYFLFPLALALFVRWPRALASAGLGLWLLHYGSKANSIDTLALPAFFMGIFAADFYLRRPSWMRFAPYALVAAVAIGLVTQPYTRFPIWEVAVFALFLWAIWSEPMRNILAWKPIAFIGVASYSIYLVQEPAIAWSEQAGAHPVLAATIGLAAGIAFWALVERPLLMPARRAAMIRFVLAVLARCIDYANQSSPQRRRALTMTFGTKISSTSCDARPNGEPVTSASATT